MWSPTSSDWWRGREGSKRHGSAPSSWPSRRRQSWTCCPPRRLGTPYRGALPTRWSGAVSPAHGPRRPGFYLGVLAVGFVLGGLLHAFLRRFLPQGPARELFTWSVTPTIGPIHLDLLVLSITMGPIGLDVSLLAVVGVAIAFLVARSLF
ncbi:MAG: hypothetical protein DMD54_14150 [Gemmatimonadetes bacterium]|nr:MAG: hypothetical protein DMD54_14150 [Gemmatimonadota bacterium]